MRSLYLCYFGLREPLVQNQVLPYLRELRRGDSEVTLLTFEPNLATNWTQASIRRERERLEAEGIGWHARAYHRRPSVPATAYDVAVGAAAAVRLHRRLNFDTIHARSHVACLMGMLAKRLTGARLIFDIRGFLPEEYVDSGVWPRGGWLYRLAKRVEARMLRESDGFVVLTERAREILFPHSTHDSECSRPVEVIPCCVDLSRFPTDPSRFRETRRRELGVEGRRVIVYLGSLGGWYLTEETADFLAEAYHRDTSMLALILTQSSAEMIEAPLRARGVPPGGMRVIRVPPGEVPSYLCAADVALSFIRPCYSKQSSSPTKVAEYLACGLPVVSSAGIGDLDDLIKGDKVGILVHQYNASAYRQALSEVDRLLEDVNLASRCRAAAREHFDLKQVGGPRYRRLYELVHSRQAAALSASRSPVRAAARGETHVRHFR